MGNKKRKWESSCIYPRDRVTITKYNDLFSNHFYRKINEFPYSLETFSSIEHSLVRGLYRYLNIIHLLIGFEVNPKIEEFDGLQFIRNNRDLYSNYSSQLIDALDTLIYNNYFDQSKITLVNQLVTTIKNAPDIYEKRRLENIAGHIKPILDSFEITKNVSYAGSYSNDHNKIVSSSAFRRLQDKAQVFPLEPNDYIRTRLTHTMEVSSISRIIGSIIEKSLSQKQRQFNLLSSLERNLECVSLIHDIGNPPYGHYGEQIIQKYFTDHWDELSDCENKSDSDLFHIEKDTCQMYQDFACFDGNAQSLRIVTKLQRYRYGHPLEISAGILGALIKYPYNSLSGKKKKKIGYFYSERDVAMQLCSLGVLKSGIRNPLSMLLEAADDISYTIADLDDAIKKGIITREIFENAINKYKCTTEVQTGHTSGSDSLTTFFDNYYDYYRINAKEHGDETFIYTLSIMLYDLKRKLILQATNTFINNYADIMDGIVFDGKLHDDKKKELLKINENGTTEIVEWFGKYLKKPYVYLNHDVIQAEVKGETVLTALLREFVSAMMNLNFSKNENGERTHLEKNRSREKRIFSLISKNFIENFYTEYDGAIDPNEKTYCKLKLVVDFVSGMTDTYALETYQILQGIQ